MQNNSIAHLGAWVKKGIYSNRRLIIRKKKSFVLVLEKAELYVYNVCKKKYACDEKLQNQI